MSTNIINDSGSFAISSRIRRLYEGLTTDMTRIYQEQDLPLETKDFIIYYLLSTRKSISISAIARELSLTHPAVIHTAKSLEKIGYVTSEKSAADNRMRLLKLTNKGKRDLVKYQELWKKIAQLNQNLFEQQTQLLEQIEKTEQLLNEKTYYQRFLNPEPPLSNP